MWLESAPTEIVWARHTRGSRQLLAVVVSLDDITEQRRVEAQLRQADRLASLGTLAAGVAHEVNNPLAYVQSNLEYVDEALRRLPGGMAVLDDLHGALRDALDGVERVKRIVQGLRHFATRPRSADRRTVDPRRQIEAAASLVRNVVSQRARLRLEVPDVLPPVMAGEFDVSQVLVNLIVNAPQAIPEGYPAENEVRVSARILPGGRIAIEVADTGSGIAPEDLPRVFDPFFTTKPVGGGTGLGLSICHGIVSSLGGTIEVESTPGCGTTFCIILPAAAESRPEPAPEVPEPARGHRARVLVVDDEPLVGRSLARALAPLHDVLALTSAVDALRRARAGESWDVVLCDLMMPDMTGMELEAALAAARPDLVPRLLYLTGGAFTDHSRAFLAHRPYLEKPVDTANLRAAVAELVASGTPSPPS